MPDGDGPEAGKPAGKDGGEAANAQIPDKVCRCGRTTSAVLLDACGWLASCRCA